MALIKYKKGVWRDLEAAAIGFPNALSGEDGFDRQRPRNRIDMVARASAVQDGVILPQIWRGWIDAKARHALWYAREARWR